MLLQAGAKVIFDLASFEIVRRFNADIWDIINSGQVYAVFGNADEWQALSVGCEALGAGHQTDADGTGAELAGLHHAQACVVRQCHLAVATRGSQGCIALERTGGPCACPALVLEHVKDPTGAGDLFAAGFVHGMLSGVSTRDCCRIGCTCGAAATQVGRCPHSLCTAPPRLGTGPSGIVDSHVMLLLDAVAAVVQVDGAEMTPSLWSWVYSQLDGLPTRAKSDGQGAA